MSGNNSSLLDNLYSHVRTPVPIPQTPSDTSDLINRLLSEHTPTPPPGRPSLKSSWMNASSPAPIILRALALAAFVPGIAMYLTARHDRKKMDSLASRQSVHIDGTAAADAQRRMTKHSRSWRSYSYPYMEATVDYVYEGKTYSKTFRNDTSWKPRKGDRVPLQLNPDNPEDCSVVGAGTHDNSVTGAAGSVLMVIGICLYAIALISLFFTAM